MECIKKVSPWSVIVADLGAWCRWQPLGADAGALRGSGAEATRAGPESGGKGVACGVMCDRARKVGGPGKRVQIMSRQFHPFSDHRPWWSAELMEAPGQSD